MVDAPVQTPDSGRVGKMAGRAVSSKPASGMAPPDDDVAIGELPTPVGLLGVLVSPCGLAGVCWGRYDLSTIGRPVIEDRDRTASVLGQLAEYFAGERRQFDLELDLRGATRSRRLVLTALCDTVPYGSSVTYGELGHRSGTGIPARGIGSIMGSNPIPIVIPCHRVLASNGLGGYSGGHSGDGSATKRWLLTMEGLLSPTLDWTGPGELDRQTVLPLHQRVEST